MNMNNKAYTEPKILITVIISVILSACATGSGGGGSASRPDFNSESPNISKPAKKSSAKKITKVKPAAREVAKAPVKTTSSIKKCKVKNDSVAWIHIKGDCKDGYADGEGEAKSVDGKRQYIGMFDDGFFSDDGYYDWGNGITYRGKFLESRKNGKGTLNFPDQQEYTGEFENNLYHGDGEYTESDGSKYVGEFESGKYQGRGKYTWANGDVYDGTFNMNQMSGEGVYSKANGEQYIGEFANNKKNGNGTYSWPSGDKYTGQFKDEKMNGEGEYLYADGSSYIGEFKNGLKHGSGTLNKDGEEINQQWENGEKIEGE